jgi:hypothetical protein
MTTSERAAYTFDLAEEMIEELAEEFAPAKAVEELGPLIEHKQAEEADPIARAHFEDYGRRLMERTLALGEKYPDRTYEVMLAVEGRTGNDGWPSVAQRPLEIALLGSQPIYTLPIVENSAYRFTWKLAFCETYKQLEERIGGETAARLPCQAGCIAATKRAFAEFGFDVEVIVDARMPDDEYCQFTAPRAPRHTQG